jgi:gamma-F420-2:alpha-L-glutamate ligase
MKKGIAILNAYDILPGAEHMYQRMREELAKRDIALDRRSNAEIISFISSKGEITGPLPSADFILYLDKDLYSSHMLEKKGYRLFNSASAIEICDDKMLTHMSLANSGIKMPKTISGPLSYSPKENPEFVENLCRELSFPLIAKENFGSLGEGVYLINSKDELTQIERKLRYEPRLYQEFIASSRGFDFRIIVVGGHFVTGMKRTNLKGDFRSNIALGGVGEKVSIPQSFIETAEKAAQVINLDYCGVDLLQGEGGEPILCEVNSNAFIAGIEEVTGVNVAGVFARHIEETIYKTIK